jgi:hypothetical protein
MKLYLHIGTEKTGSSFLQSYLANNRDLLKKHSIYYPTAGKREADMKAGRISPGNASKLNEHIDNKDWDNVKKWMLKVYNEAKTRGCTRVLLSNEILIKTFSKPLLLKSFKELCDSINFDLQPMLLIIREPLSQAMSLYKHRSKRGDMLPIKVWLEENYILPKCLKSFYDHLSNANLNILQYPYKAESFYLANICLNDWLNLNEKIEVEHTKINPSLTLSELVLLSKIKDKNAFLANQFYQIMLNIDTDQKSKDDYIKEHIRNDINNHLVQYNDLWLKVNSYMKGDFKIKSYSMLKNENIAKQMSFTEVQIEAIAKFTNDAGSMKTFLKKLKLNTKKTILRFLSK